MQDNRDKCDRRCTLIRVMLIPRISLKSEWTIVFGRRRSVHEQASLEGMAQVFVTRKQGRRFEGAGKNLQQLGTPLP